ncbi:BON domain-containing protein [Legionella oakridgensis]|uniref:Osmotically inducible protein Y n=2 Tax=Legionella oakridgensis TaxID=29423 RepID=A0A0W0XGT9_9GAMM|nr:BON domain-containing protein [Legionella oakridgensis]AHE65929.1 putative periplasmic or secreted lipoprotein [Legionella oakridgensis ATCC 33761 = DSM 21215]ETO94304.1 putative periplasmic or secreted lipoprotein [Legionella oakridgensis RV-2-2007]KTD43782.1 osmotically inducible protein Y [Legionella oakridgensis]STY15860.1 osmotically inducible protein Y [Legionella longbeachae]
MDKLMKLKAVAILICSSLAGSAMADDPMMNGSANGTKNGQTATQAAQPGDAKLTSDVNTALADYAGKINVSVKGGVVYLSGQLPSDTDYEKAVTLAESTKGVLDVNVDNLTVKDSKNPLYDSYLTAKVKGALIQTDVLDKDIPSWSVSVETKNGEVFLSGTVKSDQEKQEVVKVVNSVNGVTKVNDQLQVGKEDATKEQTNTDMTTPSDSSSDASSGSSSDESGSDTMNNSSY